MKVSAGTRLGPYEILAPLGAGGMGEVWRAKDTRLGRDVAIKVLPERMAGDPAAMARFEREAKIISSLNHPHICALFDVGRERDADYLVMELVEGESLAERLAKGPLPLEQLLKLGIEIADALAKAHRAGVVHRDMKPGNIMLTRSGAKLMDFGLARTAATAGGGSGSGVTMTALTHSPTVARPLTTEGTIVGTFQYMAPEQLEGKEADARSDLWALGCVLYEMATGRRAFAGTSQASLISSIMKDDPRSILDLAPLTPPSLERAVRQCLAKDPDERWQSAGDLMRELRWIAEAGSRAGVPAPVATRRRIRERTAWGAAALGLAVGLLSVPALLGRFERPPSLQLSITAPENLEFSPYWSDAAISPDGRFVGFAAQDSSGVRQLWLRPLDSPEARPLPGTVKPLGVFWSPDSRFIATFTPGDHRLLKVPVAGGSPLTISQANQGRGGTWNSKGTILFAPAAEGPLFSVPEGGGEPVQVTQLDAGRHEITHRYPCFLPDGEHFLFASLPAGPNGWDIYAGSLGSKSVKKILTARSAAVYADPGYLVFARDGKVMAQRFDAGRLSLAGDPVALADAPVASEIDAEPVASASRDGRLVFPLIRRPDTRLEWLDRTGAGRGALALRRGPWRMGAISPDGRFAAVHNGDDLWRVDLARSIVTRVTSGGALYDHPVWSPDGSRIAFDMNRSGRGEIQIADASGGGEVRTLPTTDHLFKQAEDWTPDGRTLVFGDLGSSNVFDIWTVPVSGEGKAAPFLQTPFSKSGARVSPDGRWILYQSNESGTQEMYVRSFPTPGHKVQISRNGANGGGWVRGGKEILYVNGLSVMSVPVKVAGADLQPGEPVKLFDLPRGFTGAAGTRDGERFLLSMPTGETEKMALRVVLGWTTLVNP
jgi:serine/threonine protein kinase